MEEGDDRMADSAVVSINASEEKERDSLPQLANTTHPGSAAEKSGDPISAADEATPLSVSPEERASFFSLLVVGWLDPLLRQGWKKPLEAHNLYPILPHRQAKPLADLFEEAWEKQTADHSAGKGKAPTVLGTTLKMFGYKLFPWGFLKMIADACMASTSLLVQGLIRFLVQSVYSSDPPPAWQGFLYALGFMALTFTASVLNAYVMQTSCAIGVSIKGMLTAALYRKSLRLSGSGRAKFPSGTMLNLVSTDLGRIEMAFTQINFIWTFPMWFLVTVILMTRIIGWQGLVGIGVMLMFLPLQWFMIRKLMHLRKETAEVADTRMKPPQLTSEILQGIRIIKYFAWEPNFLKRISDLRFTELGFVKSAAYIRSVIQSLGFGIPAISSAVTFLVYGATIDSTSLDPSLIFAALALFNQLRQPVMWMPVMVATCGDAYVAFKRLQDVFESGEVEFKPIVDSNTKWGVEVADGEFVWETTASQTDNGKECDEAASARLSASSSSGTVNVDEENAPEKKEVKDGSEEISLQSVPLRPTLRNINLQAPKGGLTAVVGAVGSGKSSLISAMIGEMKSNRGSVTFSGSVGYTTQQAWIVNASVKENILFGRPYDEKKYNEVVRACCLLPDFAVLPDGDLSEIGERGINISGGQKQRVSLARLMYTDSTVALLDDPLSAVDANVGKTIFEKGILGLLANRTRILVTHHLHLLPRCDWIVVMRDGEIAEQGTFLTLMKSKLEFTRLMVAHGGALEEEDQQDHKAEEEIVKAPKKDEKKADADTVEVSSTGKPKHEQIKKEEQQTGSIQSSVFIAYVRNFGSSVFVWVTVVALLFTQVTRLSSDLWLVSWTQLAYPELSRNAYMGTYAGLGIAQSLALLGYSMLFAIGGIHAAKRLHEIVLSSAVASPVGFFDQTPLGRIVNRLSRDVDYADNNIYDAFRLFFYSLLQLFAAFGLVCYFTKGIFAGVLVPLLGLYYFTQMVYRATSREVKRIESVSRSPLYAHIQESMNGLSTIRAYGEQSRFVARTEKLVDLNNSPLYILYTGQRWIQLRLETIGNLFVFTVALYSAAARSSINPSQMGLALSYLLQTTSLLNMAIFQAVEVEVQLNAIERLVEYTKLAPEEDPATLKDEVPANWPSAGGIDLEQIEMRYQPDLPLVLRGITLSIKPGEKIGVVGRTGSGKSSLMQALFRMVPLSSGRILIDGVDTGRLRLKDLRERIAIIPQDPVLFSGSVRANLDPTSKFGDDEIWRALEKCGMKEAVAAMDGKLEASFVENGENISVGQRQLICLARACLQRPKILVLDECTASVDMETDELIQKTIKEEFANATTLTIAHRLNTIIDSERILVLNHGEVLEFDTPHRLLVELGEKSEFGRLVGETGEASVAHLRTRILQGAASVGGLSSAA
ncbi:Multidrug resistance-associated protein 1 [Phlyctochytrium planicorne]|nr:Multidrug resistance-associated protein 1 [Phlyctochytrium planicorne]